MPFTEKTGDLFEMGLPAIGHGCNQVGVMGAGIALSFRIRYPEMTAAYRSACFNDEFPLGGYMHWETLDGLHIYNLATQGGPGPCAELGAISTSVSAALADCQKRGIPTLGIPRIGAGIGGLRWEDVRGILTVEGGRTTVELVVASLPPEDN